ncbi:penicillin-binding protein activator [Sphingomonas sp.]|uniref:penicillin-binding protein activator n=1 Tax=Sphingomonas sp. TaxID=28214 RepID=UPI001EB93F97|nr:penicillin-binding protein activator [Sphingomonas sp.]MBX3593280.1 penicillin-binding protein activator [Sphingomonas sp.]
MKPVRTPALHRRDLLKLLQSACLLPPALLASPSVLAAGFDAKVKRDKRPVAMLLPLSGPRAALGLSMRQAVLLADSGPEITAYDTGGTAAGAALAARNALKAKAAMIVGPVTAEETAAVEGEVQGRVPVIAFSNNAVVRGPGAFLFGITPSQVTSAILRYARSRGVKDVVVIDDASPWSAAAALAAGKVQGEIGIDVRALTVQPGQPLPAAGDAPDAVLLPGSGEAVLAAARNLKGSGIQLLGTVQALDFRPAALEVLDGAWLASPDPAAFGKFASDYRARHGGDPGVLAALAYDAGGIVKTLREKGSLDQAALLAETSYRCVTGNARFRSDGSVARELAIVVAGPQGYEPVAVSLGA